jgi:hypothetical protein
VLQLGQVPGDRHLEIPIHEQHKLARSPARPPPPVPSRPLSSKQAAEREREREAEAPPVPVPVPVELSLWCVVHGEDSGAVGSPSSRVPLIL